MVSLTPPAEIANASALLALISDPKAAKKRLDDLMAAEQTIGDMAAKIQQSEADAKAAVADSEAKLAEFAAKQDQAAREADALKADQDAREQRLVVRAMSLADAQASHAASVEAAKQSAIALDERAAKLAEAERNIQAREDAVSSLEAIKAEYERKLAALSKAMEG